MAEVFLKQKSDSQEIFNKDTGELTDLYETFTVDEETWFKLYTTTFASYCDNLTGNAIKFFSKCLKYSQEDNGEGNYFLITNPYLKKELEEMRIKGNISKYLKELIDNKFIYKIRRSQYGINPKVAYCGTRHNRARLVLNLIKEKEL